MLSPGPDRPADPPRRAALPQRPRRARRGHRVRPRPARRARQHGRRLRTFEIPYDSLIVAAGVDPVVLRPRRAGPLRAGHEDDRRRPRAAPADLRGVRDGRAVADDPGERAKWLTIVIVGAGPTGVELAGQVRELAVRCLKGEFRTFDPASVRVLLLDGGKEPLATFGDRLSGKATKELEHAGVELRMGARVVGVDATGVDVTGADGSATRIDAYTTIWAAGVQASPLAAALADRERRRGRPGRAHRGPPRPHAARPSRGLRRSATWRRVERPPRRRRGRHAGRAARGQHDLAPRGGQGRGRLHVPRPRQRRRRSGASAPSPACASSASAGSPAGSCGSSSTWRSSPASATGSRR